MMDGLQRASDSAVDIERTVVCKRRLVNLRSVYNALEYIETSTITGEHSSVLVYFLV